jgi:chemotaxis protein methyltransferase CheR
MADVTLGLSASQEFDLTDDDFDRIRKLIYEHAGIALSDAKRQLAYSRVGRRLRALGLTRFSDYLDRLEGEGGAEWQEFTNALTTNLTSFFREEHHFPILAEHAKKAGGRNLTLWCSACSTGEEPYSMAITMAEAFNTLTPPVRILATDVDTNVVAASERGVYAMERLEKMSPERLRRFFQKGSGANAGHARVRKELRDLITFRPLNLLHDNWPIRGPLDVIFCRNVMIYFDKATQYRILKKFAPLMRADGLMFAGHSENFIHAADLFRLRGKTVYELSPKYRQGHAAATQR